MSAAPAFTPHRYKSACGRLDLFARIYPGEGPTLLLMHGLTRNSADFDPLVPHLAGRYRLVVPDQRGRGRSDYDDDASRYRPDVYAMDMFTLLDGLDVRNCAIVGTSMGGLIGMIMAFMQPSRIAAMVMNDIGARLEPAGLARIQGYVGPGTGFDSWDQAAQACGAINATAFPGFGEVEWLAFARRTCEETSDGKVRFAYDPAIATSVQGEQPDTVPPDLWPLWDSLAALPVLLLRGALSDLLSTETAEEMERRHSGPFRHVAIPSRGHAPLLDEPEALSAIEPFLEEYGT